MAQLTFIIYSESEDFVAHVSPLLDETGHATIAAKASDPNELASQLAMHRPDVLFIDSGSDPLATMGDVHGISGPQPLVLVAGPKNDTEFILRALREGAREIVSPRPGAEEVVEAVERLVAAADAVPSKAEARGAQGRVIAVMGAKGGVGATALACQLAFSLQRHGGRTALIDLNLPLGDVALQCDLQPRYSIASLAAERAEIDSTFLDRLLASHETGVHVLASPRRPEEAEEVRGEHVETAIELLRDSFDWIVIDVSRSWNVPSVRALDLADQILVVCVLDVPTLGHARHHLDLLERLGHSQSKIRLIANRFSNDSPVSGKDCKEFLGHEPDVYLRNDYRTMAAAVNEGRPIFEASPKAAIVDEFHRFAERVHEWCGVEENTPDNRANGIRGSLRKLFRKG